MSDIDPEVYKWSEARRLRACIQKYDAAEDAEYDIYWTRPLLGIEVVWNIKPRDSRLMTVASTLDLTLPILVQSLESKLSTAWRHFLTEVPEVMASTLEEEGHQPFLIWGPVPPSQEELDRWIDDTAKKSFIFDRVDAQLNAAVYSRSRTCEMRQTLMDKIRDLGPYPNAYLYAVGHANSKGVPWVKSVQVIISFDHRITDGIGARILFGKFLGYLANYLVSSAHYVPRNCTQPWKNLAAPWICVMDEACLRSEKNFRGHGRQMAQTLMEQMVGFLI
jgi:hypothetical protein